MSIKHSNLIKILCLLICIICLYTSVAVPYVDAVAVVDDIVIAILFGILAVGGIYLAANGVTRNFSDADIALANNFFKSFPDVKTVCETAAKVGVGSFLLSAATFKLVMDSAQTFFGEFVNGEGSVAVAGASFSMTGYSSSDYLESFYPFGRNVSLRVGSVGHVRVDVTVPGYISSPFIYDCDYSCTSDTVAVSGTWTSTYNGQTQVDKFDRKYYGTASVSDSGFSYFPLTFSFYQSSTVLYVKSAFESYGVGRNLTYGLSYNSAFVPQVSITLSGDFDGIGQDVIPVFNDAKYKTADICDVIGRVGVADEANGGALSIPVNIPQTVPTTQTGVLTDDVITELDKTQAGTGGGSDTSDDDKINKFKVPPLIFTKFPFCLPYDLYAAFALLQADAEVPRFEFVFPVHYERIGGEYQEYKFGFDLEQFAPVVRVFRWCMLLLFIIIMIGATRKLIGA